MSLQAIFSPQSVGKKGIWEMTVASYPEVPQLEVAGLQVTYNAFY